MQTSRGMFSQLRWGTCLGTYKGKGRIRLEDVDPLEVNRKRNGGYLLALLPRDILADLLGYSPALLSRDLGAHLFGDLIGHVGALLLLDFAADAPRHVLAHLTGDVTTHLARHLDGDGHTHVLQKICGEEKEVRGGGLETSGQRRRCYLCTPALRLASEQPLAPGPERFCTLSWEPVGTSSGESAWAPGG